MNWHTIVTIYLKELKDSLRDRRTLISMIVVPTLLMPVIMFGAGYVMSKVMRQAKAEATSLVVLGGADSPAVVAALKADPKFKLVEPYMDFKKMISEKHIRLAVEIPEGFEAALQNGEARTVTLYHYQGEMKSSMGVGEVERFFRNLREKTVETRLTARGLPADLVHPFEIKQQNVAPPAKVGGNIIGGLVPYIIIILCFTGAMYPAIDLTAGEKERGTMETLLCSPVHRVNIVLGKFLMVMTASIATIALTLVSTAASIILGGSMLAGKGGGAAAAGGGGFVPVIDPAGILGVFAMIAPVATFFAAILLTISLFAKSYKEAQSYVSPLIIVVLLPAMMGMLPGIELSAKTALIPILNVCLACKEMLSGVWHWGYLALIFGSTAAFAAGALALCVWMFNREDVMFRA
ncbi:ABC-2 family transporter protein [Lacunisphaera limnophila]|uniref:ABC-2 family transporter protein n=1 Tax=Lacunisphaera limnophila TaxID=1838286 RepID=A0A1D8ASK3_9BACT|nr:ABC transporter permease [Lacunisphaera limnophila]AOS43878.1 ABC-2 family transporter protein [Lacunisphaera limnophila]